MNCLVFGQFRFQIRVQDSDLWSFFQQSPMALVPLLTVLPPLFRWDAFGATISVLISSTIGAIGTLTGLGPLCMGDACHVPSSFWFINSSSTSQVKRILSTSIHLQIFILVNVTATLLLCGFFTDSLRQGNNTKHQPS